MSIFSKHSTYFALQKIIGENLKMEFMSFWLHEYKIDGNTMNCIEQELGNVVSLNS
jgi:hypothetical protein